METRLITHSERDLWNDFVANSPESPILQSYEWGDLKARFGWQPIRLAVEENGKLIAGISILKREVPYIRHSFFYAPRGPVVDFANRNALDFLLHAVEKEAEHCKAFSLKIDPDLAENQHMNLALLKRLGFVKSAKQVQPRATILLDLQPELEQIMKSFEEKTRYNIRLAEKKGVEVQEHSDELGMDIFYRLYQETAQRDNFMIHPLSYYKAIKELLLDRGLGKVFVAYHDKKAIGAVVIFAFGKKIWYMYGASASSMRNLMPNHLLHWRVIQWAKEQKYETYDLWGIPVNPKEGHPLFGVYRFKKGFNGKLVVNIGAYDFPYSHLFYVAFEHGLDWLKIARSFLTKGKVEDSLGE